MIWKDDRGGRNVVIISQFQKQKDRLPIIQNMKLGCCCFFLKVLVFFETDILHN